MDVSIPTPILQGLGAIGLLYLFAKVFSFVRLLFSLFILPGTSISRFAPKGTWAVVTGASDGIGKEFALQLAAKGYNIVLVSRTASKLDALARDISKAYPAVKTRTHAMDFTKNDDADYTALRELTSDADVAILVNNVGQSHSIPVPFTETPQREMLDIINVNCAATLRVTQLFAPQMAQRRRGLILTMASFGGVLPTPLLATYSGSKAFLQQWSTALGSELAPHGVRVQLVQSYLVTSAMSKIKRASALVPTPRQFVRSALASIGRSGGSQGVAWTSSPYWSHGMMQWALMTVTGTMNKLVVDTNRSMHEGIRKRALRKAERDAKKAS